MLKATTQVQSSEVHGSGLNDELIAVKLINNELFELIMSHRIHPTVNCEPRTSQPELQEKNLPRTKNVVLKMSIRLPIEIKISPFLLDHRFEGKAVLPAVEAMQLLALSTQNYLPDTDVRFIENAKFDKFLYIEPDTPSVEAFNEIELFKNGCITAKLITKKRSKNAGITRIKEHVVLQFSDKKPDINAPPLDIFSAGDKGCFNIQSDKLYKDLVPFGPSYQNIKGTLPVSEKGAMANIHAPRTGSGDDSAMPLGSPFPLDAAFHAACAWGQRYMSVVGFPVGFDKRLVVQPTQPGDSYTGYIIPVKTSPDLLIFDIYIYDVNGVLRESILGVQMRDVSAGRMKPPGWVVQSYCSA